MCPGFSGIPLPCALMYSRIPISMNVLYPLTIAIFTAYRFRQTLINLVFFTSEQYKFSYENESSDFQVSMMLFNAWEFKVDNPIDFKSQRLALHNMIFTEIREQILKSTIKERTRAQWRKLYIKRFFLIGFNVLFLAGCATGIITSSISKNEIV